MKLIHNLTSVSLFQLAVILVACIASTVYAAPPANDNFAAATLISGSPGTQLGTNVEATVEVGESSDGAFSIWYSWTAPAAGTFQFDTNGSGVSDTRLHVYTGSQLSALTLAADNDDGGDGLQSLLTFSATQSTVYHIRVSGYATTTPTGTITLNWTERQSPANDNFAAAEVLTGQTGTVNGSNVAATSESGEVDDGVGNSVWYIWTAPLSGTAQFDTFGSSLDTVLSVGTGTSHANIQFIAQNNDAADAPPPGTSSKVRFPITSGTEYRIRIDGNAAPSAFTLNWLVSTVPLNDNFADARALTGATGSTTGDTTNATLENADLENKSGLHSVWFSWTAPFTGTVQFDTFGSELDSNLAFGTGSSIATFRVIAENEYSEAAPLGESTSRVRVAVTLNTTYYIRLNGRNDGGTYTLNWAQVNYTPSIIRFSAANYSFGEDDFIQDITLTREIGTDDELVFVNVFLSYLSAGSADATSFGSIVSFSPGESTTTFAIHILQDKVSEGEETIVLTLGEPFGESVNLSTSPAILTIVDDEPMIPVKASYAGLVRLAVFDEEFNGAVSMKTDAKNGFTGIVALNGSKYRFKGAFGADGKAVVSIPRKNGLPTLTLNIAYAAAGGFFRTTLTDGVLVDGSPRTATFDVRRGGFSSENYVNSTFTVHLPGDRLAVGDVPRGDGFLSASINRSGFTKVVGSLSDGTPISYSGPLVGDGILAIYASLYKGKGSINGELVLSGQNAKQAVTINWDKAANPRAKAFPDGFSFNIEGDAYAYNIVPAAPILSNLAVSNGGMEFFAEQGGLLFELSQGFVLTADNRIHLPVSPSVKLKLKINPKTGIFTGKFQSEDQKPTSFKGAFFQDSQFGGGYFIGDDFGEPSGGAITLNPAL